MFLSDTVKPLFSGDELLYPHTLAYCPVCGDISSDKLFVLRGFIHRKCSACGFIFVNPRLNEEGARIYYNSEYYRHYCDNNERPVNERFGPFCRTLGEELPGFIRYLCNLCPGGRIVDVGCGLGGLLASMPDDAFERIGIEYNEAAAQFARERYGLSVLSDIDMLKSEQSTFDLVTAVEIIEHVADPLIFMHDLSQLLRPAGYLVVTTPNIATLEYRLYGRRCGHFCAPSHVNFFNVDTLTRLAARAGLQSCGHWYRGGGVSFRHWWRTRGTEVDFWSPEVPTRNSGNVVYRPLNDGHIDLPAHQSLDKANQEKPNRQPIISFLGNVYNKVFNSVFAPSQMVVVFRRK